MYSNRPFSIFHLCYCFFSSDSKTRKTSIPYHLSPAGFVPGPVQNLTSFLDTSQPSLTLNWDMPNNIKTTDDIVYDIHFKQRPFKREEGWDQGHGMTADAKPAMGVHSSSHLARKTPTQGGGHRNAPHRPLLSFCPTYHPLLPTSHPPPAPTSACEIQLQIVSSSEQRLTVKAPTTSILLTRESGLIPLTTCDFKVRARSQDGATKWRTVSTCFGKCRTTTVSQQSLLKGLPWLGQAQHLVK